jgi:hypothetical protein
MSKEDKKGKAGKGAEKKDTKDAPKDTKAPEKKAETKPAAGKKK